MIGRIASLPVIVWALGFLWFATAMPQPAGKEKTDAIVVPTGSGGRIPRGLAMLKQGAAPRMLVTGVFSSVTPQEFAAEYGVSSRTMECCVTLGFAALDTRGNARETAEWVESNKVRSIRLVTSDWHMRRAAKELEGKLPPGTVVVRDAVRSQPSLWTLFLEYHKLLATQVGRLWPA
ncbi:MAG TPA: YdcF family protein [Croceibacterium sp.]|nr:YdcF family protein [Croceibacterium sp.]